MYGNEVPVRRKPPTYGKSTTKRISSLSFDPVVQNSSVRPVTSTGRSPRGLNLTGFRSTSASEVALDEATTSTADLSKDIFDFPSDEDDKEVDNNNKDDQLQSKTILSKAGRRGESQVSLFHGSSRSRRERAKPLSLNSRLGQSTQSLQNLASNDSSKFPICSSESSQTSQCGVEKRQPSARDKKSTLESDKSTPNPKRKLPVSPTKSLTPGQSKTFFKHLNQSSLEIHDMLLSVGEAKLSRPLLQERPKSSDQSGSQLDRSLISKIGERSKKKFKSSPTSEPSHSPAPCNLRAATRSRSRPTADSHPLSLRSLEREYSKPPHEINSAKNLSFPDSCEVNSMSKSTNHKIPQTLSMYDANMVDNKPKKEVLSKSQKFLEDLLASTGETRGNLSYRTKTNCADAASSSIVRVDANQHRPEVTGETAQAGVMNSRPPRLIDSLVRQASNADSSDENDDESENDSEGFKSDLEPRRNLGSDSGSLHGSSSGSFLNDKSNSQSMNPESQSSISSQSIGPKFTYSRQRSMLAEEDLMKELALDLLSPVQVLGKQRNRRGSIPEMKPCSAFYEEDEEENSQVVIKSVHELRKSGANKRFIDECIDFLDRIGSPGEENNSSRRSGLLDLASKMRQMNFAQQFRSNSMERQLFIHLEKEVDTLSGFLIISILISVLMEGTGPQIIHHLCQQGIMKLIIRLIECDVCISSVCENGQNNLSKVTQLLLIEHHDCLLQSDIWEKLKPEVISSRTLALKCLDMMVRQIREAENFSDIFPEELNTRLFEILDTASDEESWDLPKNKKAVDFSLAVAALQVHSVAAYPLHESSIWISDYLPKLADVLELSLSRPSKLCDVQLQILKMTLQVTNDNQLASEVFARPSLIFILCRDMVFQFQMIHSNLPEEKFKITLDYLSLLLGILMNFSEWSPGTRECLQNFQSQNVDPLEELLHIFSEQSAGIAQAESEQETLKNVVLSYLAVSLGFLSLHPEIGQRIAPQKKGLVNCIEEFISIHKLADGTLVDCVEQSASGLAEENAHLEAQKELTERLERLVRRLKCTG
ncbi:hypothetical protein K3495_g8950 [Podosphaera aphanis]|nr:hypothetical protein K3495_g8950 [Podosphaera aphanis]